MAYVSDDFGKSPSETLSSARPDHIRTHRAASWHPSLVRNAFSRRVFPPIVYTTRSHLPRRYRRLSGTYVTTERASLTRF